MVCVSLKLIIFRAISNKLFGKCFDSLALIHYLGAAACIAFEICVHELLVGDQRCQRKL
jgi:hypothetical protein